MAQRSSIEQLPKEDRQWLEKALIEKNFSGYVEFEKMLKEKGYQISKSAIHRYGQKIENRLKAIKESAEIAKLITQQTADEEANQSDALMQLIQTDLMNILVDVRNAEEMNVKDRLKMLSSVGKNIASMISANVKLKQYQAEHKEKLLAKLDELKQNAKDNGADIPTLELVHKGLLETYGISN
ncbi:DUF3486 family protein [Phocoenobacter skyensis]|uniref:DUF3486 family protein n=1 Tax=Phocoenobacter skyensis TaxID=97481 RepID=A0ABT9JN39_9PAST|nr:DUF3486 family protein [Pasteurella skyensis]MDP8080234.1 DUF3486 family protein [Pasteurella skyensis]MDP8086227.1 DUF3486 family protein [Pasteurella skyensis]